MYMLADIRMGIRPVKLSLSISFLTAIFQVTGLAGVYWNKGWWRWWWQLDYWSCKSCKAPVKSSPPTNQHLVFFTGRMSFVSSSQQHQKHWRENITFQAHLGVFQLCLRPLTAPGYLGGGLPCLSSALWCQYPNIRPVKLCTKTDC